MALPTASDNPFPSILIAEGTEPAAPAAGKQRLYIDSTSKKLKRTDSAGVDVTIEGTALVTTTRGDLIRRGASADERVALGTAAYGLVSDGTDAVWAEILPWHVNVLPQVMTPDATNGTWVAFSLVANSGMQLPFYIPGSAANSGSASAWTNSAPANTDTCSWDVVLAKGTWDAHFWVAKDTNKGIITLNQDGASQGTVDTYAAAAAGAKVSITGWTVASTGKKRMQIAMATKNASSSNFNVSLFGIEFRRTA